MCKNCDSGYGVVELVVNSNGQAAVAISPQILPEGADPQKYANALLGAIVARLNALNPPTLEAIAFGNATCLLLEERDRRLRGGE